MISQKNTITATPGGKTIQAEKLMKSQGTD